MVRIRMKSAIRHHKVIMLIALENKHRGRVRAAPGRRLAKHAANCLFDHAIDERHKRIRAYFGVK